MTASDQPVSAESDLALPGVATSLRALSHAASWLPVLVGGAVLLGWWRDLESVK